MTGSTRPAMLVDSHCHLADGVFAGDLPVVVERARAARVASALCIVDAGSEDERERAAAVYSAWPAVRFAVGVHPHQASAHVGRIPEMVALVERAAGDRLDVRAIGEVGLDHHYDFAPPDVQSDALAAQVELASRRGLPIVVHAREAEGAVLEVIRATTRAPVRGVFHCFTGNVETAKRVLDAGLHLGIGGIVTFPRGDSVRGLLSAVPLDRVLVETDSPFLAPVPYRGRRNEPAWVVRVAETIAEVLRLELDEVADRTTRNFHELFSP